MDTTRNLYDGETGELIGPATEAQCIASDRAMEDGQWGAILIDADGDVIRDESSWDAQQPGVRAVWVEEA